MLLDLDYTGCDTRVKYTIDNSNVYFNGFGIWSIPPKFNVSISAIASDDKRL